MEDVDPTIREDTVAIMPPTPIDAKFPASIS